jgi:predicted transposase/invertase (TIGR01784 family)
MDEDEYDEYWMQRKVEHDRISNLNGARREGEEIGREEEKLEIARKMKAAGISLEQINAITGLSFETIEQM